MRILAPIFIWLVLAGFCQAQATVGLDAYSDSETLKRWDSKAKKAMEALNSNNQGKKPKKDSMLESSFSNKAFKSSGDSLGKKANGVSPFVFDQKFTAEKFNSDRSFFGLKNPWFGSKVYNSGDADLWSKTLIANSDKKIRTGGAETKKAFDAEEKAATVEAPVETKVFIPNGSAQGSVSQISDKINKDMTIEEVRELLNKNR